MRALFAEAEILGDLAASKRRSIFRKIDEELTLHAKIEEKIFNPAFKEKARGTDQRNEVLEAYKEHGQPKVSPKKLGNELPMAKEKEGAPASGRCHASSAPSQAQ